MTDSLAEEYAQLTALAQLYLMQEYPSSGWIPASPENWQFIRAEALKMAAKQPAPPPQPPLQPMRQAPVQPSPAPPPSPKSLPRQPLQQPSTLPAPKPQTTSANVLPPSNKEVKETSYLKLEPIPSCEIESLEDLKSIYQTKFPDYPVIDSPPSDSEAKELQQLWKTQGICPEIALLSFGEPQNQQLFMQNIAKALHIRYGSAGVIDARKLEEENQWDKFLDNKKLRLVIACDYAIYGLNQLMTHYRETAGPLRHLNEVPLLLISDLSLYLKEPKLKPSLWKALSEALK